MANQLPKKVVKFHHIHWHYHNAFRVGLKERMPRIGMQMVFSSCRKGDDCNTVATK